jgi:hypothetical protein
MDLGERAWGGVDWIDLTQDNEKYRTVVNAVMSLWVIQNLCNFLRS